MNKKTNQELSFRKEKEKQKKNKKKRVCQLWDHAVVTKETNGNRGNQMMLGQCHLATSEPMKSLAQSRGSGLC